jgi:putative exporter of polyketide antibiotics
LSAFRRHAWIFAAGAALLIVTNAFVGEGWWSFWPLGAWGVVLGVHYLLHKARRVDEAWVKERTDDLRSKSYDAGHIDTIKKDAAAGPSDPERSARP